MSSTGIIPLYVYRSEHVAIHSLAFGDPVSRFDEFEEQIRSQLWAGSLEGNISLFDTTSYRREWNRPGCHGNSISYLHYYHEGPLARALLSQGRDGYVHLWDIGKGDLSQKSSIKTGSTSFCKSSVQDDSTWIASPVDDHNTFKIWDLKTLEVVYHGSESKFGMYMALNIVQHNGRPYLFALCEDGTLLVIDTIENKTLYKQQIHSDTGLSLAISQPNKDPYDGSMNSLILTGGSDNQTVVLILNWDQMSVEKLQQIDCLAGVQDIAIRQDNKFFVTGGWDKRCRIFSCKSFKPLAILKYHSGSVQSLSICRYSKLLASASVDGKICLWDVYRD